MVMMGGGGGSQTNTNAEALLYFVGSDEIASNYKGGLASCTVGWFMKATRKLRDTSSWYHLLSVWDGSQSGDPNRMKFFVNGIQEALGHDCGSTAAGFQYVNQNGQTQYIGRIDAGGGPYYSSFYLAEAYFVDGTACTPSDFIETDSTTGQIIPKNSDDVLGALTMGNNGFYLNFSDNSDVTSTTLGKDNSGNNNNWTPYNFSVSAGAGNDSVEDTPTNNFCTLNPLDKNSNATASDGNLKATGGSAAHYPIFSTFGMKGGKWYAEYRNENNNNWRHAIMNIEHDGGSLDGDSTVANNTSAVNKVGYGLNVSNGQKMHDSDSGSSYGSGLSGTSDVLQCAVDLDNGKIYWGINNTWFNSGDPAAGSNPAFSGIDTTITWTFAHHIYSSNGCTVNFGQQGFSYTPPSGFKALSSANLPDPTIKLPNEEFDTKLWTGNGGTQTITGLNFSPDFVWIKIRTQAYNHVLWDTLRGVTIRLQANKTNADGTNTNGLTAFNSDGYDLGDMNNINKSGDTFVGWNWNAGDTDSATYTVKVVSDSGNKYRFNDFGTSAVTLDLAEGGTYTFDGSDSSMSGHPFVIGTAANGSVYSTGVTYQLDGASVTYSAYTSGYSSATTRKLIITVPASAPQLYYWCSIHSGMGGAINTNTTLGSSNFDGSRHVTTKANPSAGFSIVKYTGTGSTATIGHGLGVAPEFMFVKTRTSADHWAIYHHKIGNTKVVYMDIINAPHTSSAYWNDTSPTSSVFTVGSDNKTNKSGDDFIAYCFSGVSQYSKFGEYTGNGSSDGTFIHLGFRPAFFLFRQVTYSDNWYMYDNKRDTFNPTDKELNPSNAQTEASSHDIDFLSNGVKMRTNNSSWNYNGYKYIYLAFAELPFKNARAK